MTASDGNENQPTNTYEDASSDDRKIFVSRIPVAFDEDTIIRIIEKKLGEKSVEHVALSQKKTDGEHQEGKTMENDQSNSSEHRGFAFVTMISTEKRDEAIALNTIRGKAKEGSKRKHTLYIRPIVRTHDTNGDEDDATQNLNICFLWSKFRCPYGDDCKFKHVGPGGCEEQNQPISLDEKKKKQKCFSYKTKGKCKLGDDCPYSHDFEPKVSIKHNSKEIDTKDKDCISWKTKGKCRKGDQCPYRHDDAVREAALAKKGKSSTKKRGRSDNPQPLSVRVFGLNYETTEADVREYFQHCGTIKEITFPVFEDSGRSKGYCGILFTSPKATEKACELDGQELHGRWLSVQAGKMYLKQWAEMEEKRGMDKHIEQSDLVGEFGQKVKKRKKHGFKD